MRLYDAPSPVHARQMNDANMHSIRMLIENDPKLTIKSSLVDRKKMWDWKTFTHSRTLITKFALSTKGTNK